MTKTPMSLSGFFMKESEKWKRRWLGTSGCEDERVCDDATWLGIRGRGDSGIARMQRGCRGIGFPDIVSNS